jgi:DNA-binding MarR family transcriptional regulator
MSRRAEDGAASAPVAGHMTADAANHAEDASALIQLSALVQDVFARVAQRHDLTPVQARLLCALVERPRGMAELARGFSVEKAALTGLVDRVERRGLAKRIPVPGDRRALRVTLTDTGRRSAAAFHAEVTAELARLMLSLPARERKQFQVAIATITQSAAGRSRSSTRTRSDRGANPLMAGMRDNGDWDHHQ